jgi:hypothetical protein
MSRARKYIVLIPLSLFLYLLSIPFAFSWGFHAHKKINHEAVYALSASLEAFYKKNIDYITNHAIDPDNHKYSDSLEASRHFIDIDHYGPKAFDELPKYWKAAVEKYPKDTLQKYGTLPYEVLFWLNKLTDAFKNKDGNEILRASGYIGHYIADAHVPLHTISNYNGQKTEQEGIHALWETAIPEAYSDKYILRGQKAAYIKDPETKIWEIIKQSYLLAPTVLSVEKQVSQNFSGDKKYMKPKKADDKKQFSVEYVAAYNKALNGMVAKQMQSSVLDVADFWYTAWVNAGQPDLSKVEFK